LTNTSFKILVVEDEALIRMGIVASLEDDGFIVVEASNADEAIEMLIGHPDIKAMFTDIDMPGGMDGLRLAAAVRDRWPPIQIIVTSGQVRLTQETMPVEGRFFTKPYDVNRIAMTLREMVLAA
jgi:CheY-like chemotaxis protein